MAPTYCRRPGPYLRILQTGPAAAGAGAAAAADGAGGVRRRGPLAARVPPRDGPAAAGEDGARGGAAPDTRRHERREWTGGAG